MEMARYEVYTSVDIGSKYLKGAVVAVKGDTFEVLGYAEVPSRGIDSGDIKDVSAFKESFNRILEELARQYPRISKTELLVSFSSDGFTLDTHRESFQLVEEDEEGEVLITEELLEDLKYEIYSKLSGPEVGKRVLNIFTRGFTLNGNRVVINPIDMSAREIEIEVAAVRVDYSAGEALRATLEDMVGTDPEMFATPISAAEGALTPTEKDSGVVLVDLGYNFTTVVPYLNNMPVDVRYVPLGIKNVVKDIVYVFRTSFDEAEMMLRNNGFAVYDPSSDLESEIEYREIDGRTIKKVSLGKFALVVNARLMEIFNKVRRVYKDLERNVPAYRENGIPGGVVLTGGGARIKRIEDLATQVLRTNVRIGKFVTSFPIDHERVVGGEEAVENPAFTPVFGNVVSHFKSYSEIVKSSSTTKSSGIWKGLKKLLKNLF